MSQVQESAAGLGGMVASRRVWLFDLDGTLVDSAPAHETAFREAIAELAPDLLPNFHYGAYAGASTREVFARLGAGHGVTTQLARRKQQYYRRRVDAGQVRAFPGAHELLDRLGELGRPAYLVTSGSSRSVGRVLAACGLGRRLRGVLTADDVPAAKPDPAVYRAACQRWGVAAHDAVAVEDSVHGVQSAVGAGLVTVQVHTDRPAPGAIAVRHLGQLLSMMEKEVGDGGDG